jgi:hypothetical protein
MTMASPSHPRRRLDELIHHPVRLSIMAALVGVAEAEFGVVRDAVEISDSVLSRQMTLLAEANYLKIRKGYVGRRPRTWLRATPRGRTAFANHVAALREIAGASVDPAAPTPGRTRTPTTRH